MKKLVSIFLVAVSLVLLCGCALLNLGKEKPLKEVTSERLSLSLDTATVIEEWDNHGGFHGDGETFVKLSCPDGFEENVSSKWRALPLEGDAYRYFYEWGGVLEHPETGEKLIPEVENGYWYYKATGAMNWELALYDCDTNILYFYIWDA